MSITLEKVENTAQAEVTVGTPPGRPGKPAQAPRPRRLGIALVVIAAAQLMVVLDGTIVNVALPHIQTALHFSGTNLEWVVNAYTTRHLYPLLATLLGVQIRSRPSPPHASSASFPSMTATR